MEKINKLKKKFKKEKIDGYLVSYTFNGLNYTTRTAFKPYGNTLKLRVNHSIQQ